MSNTYADNIKLFIKLKISQHLVNFAESLYIMKNV